MVLATSDCMRRVPTVWHSAAASALGEGVKKRMISRAKRSAAMPGWAHWSVGFVLETGIQPLILRQRCYRSAETRLKPQRSIVFVTAPQKICDGLVISIGDHVLSISFI